MSIFFRWVYGQMTSSVQFDSGNTRRLSPALTLVLFSRQALADQSIVWLARARRSCTAPQASPSGGVWISRRCTPSLSSE